MDPWSSEVKVCDRITLMPLMLRSFEDNFSPSSNISESLPDSKQYLDSLEKKLLKIKSNTNVLRQLSDRREACMIRLLTEGADICTEENLRLDVPISADATTQIILRHLRPERQALTVGEVVEIIKHDQLEDNLHADSDSDQADTASR